MFKALSKLFKSDSGLQKIVDEINALEPEISTLTSDQILETSNTLKKEIREKIRNDRKDRNDGNEGDVGNERRNDESEKATKEEIQKVLDEHLPRAFALVRETAKRTLKQRHFDVQLMGGITLHQGRIAEMRTGEGKTLAATLPAYLNALVGRGVHLVTVNEYLAKRDAVWMGQIYHALGLSVACLVHEGAFMYDPEHTGEKTRDTRLETRDNKLTLGINHQHSESVLLDKERDTTGSFLVQDAYLRPISRKEAYQADITYGTNHEFGFDYLRDNLAHSLEQQVQRRYATADQRGIETRINAEESQRQSVSSPRESAIEKTSLNFAIIDEVDSILIDEARTPLIISAPDTESSQLYKTFARLVTHLEKETDYLVDEKLKTVDIVEAGIDKVEKSLNVKNLYAPENLRLTHYLQESLRAKELFLKDRDYVVKDNQIIIVDQFTGRLMIGRRYSGGLHQAIEAKENVLVQQESRTYASITIQNYFRLYSKLGGMTGTAQTSAEEFDKVYKLEVVTIPTHQPMVRQDAVDFVYKTAEAKYEAIIKDIKERHQKGQPILIGTVSIEKNEELARRLARAGLPHEVLNAKNNEREGAIIAQAGKPGAITVATNMAGRGVDIILGGNPALPDEANKVRAVGGLHVIGTERHESRRIDNQLRGRAGRQGDAGSSQFFLSLEDDLMRIFGGDRIKSLMQTLKMPEDMPIQSGMINRVISQAQSKVEGMNFDARKHLLEYDDVLNKQRLTIYKKRQELLVRGTIRDKGWVTSDKEKIDGNFNTMSHVSLPMLLSALDMFWMTHLENMEALRDAVGLRAYGQHDPLVEYRREGHLMFQQLLRDFENWLLENKERLEANTKFEALNPKQIQNSNDQNLNQLRQNTNGYTLVASGSDKVGRNDPCPCGSGKKYKKCHGK